MNLTELDHALRKLRLSGMADTLELRLLESQSENQAPIDTVSALVSDELVRRLGTSMGEARHSWTSTRHQTSGTRMSRPPR